MNKILILYFSGVGAAKKVADLMFTSLLQNSKTDIFSIESKDTPDIVEYDALIIGTPVYHAAPAKAVMTYWDKTPRLSKEIHAFVYSTHGLCSLNTNRILAKKLLEKNIYVIVDKAYRSPASDGSIIAPFIKRFFEFEKNIEKKVDNDCTNFLKLLNYNTPQRYIPKFSFGSIINAPNKAIGQLITLKIHLHQDKCMKCGHCIEQCHHNVFSKDKDGYPMFSTKGCENCYRCIHHCPKTALSLSKRKTPKKLLQY